MTSGLFLSASDVASLSAAARAEVLALLGLDGAEDGADGGLADGAATVLTEVQAQRFLNNCSERTIKLLRIITAGDGTFLISDAASATRSSNRELRAAWAGLTKRTRTVTGDKEATLISWAKVGKDEWRGTLEPRTFSALKAALSQIA